MRWAKFLSLTADLQSTPARETYHNKQMTYGALPKQRDCALFTDAVWNGLLFFTE